jgi:hypothetical protein
MCAQFTDDDVGKDVVNENGETVGIVADVDHGTAHVKPDPGITDTIKAKLGWQGSDDAFPLQEAAVKRVTDDEIRLEGDLNEMGSGATTGMETGSDTRTDMGDSDTSDDMMGSSDNRRTSDDDDTL